MDSAKEKTRPHRVILSGGELLQPAGGQGLGLEHASFHWNKLPEEDATLAGNGKRSPESSIDGSTTRGDDSGSESGFNEKNTFELLDISVVFPEGKLSVITGPTAR
ncbi:hypothetical protein C8J57DRAFT_1255197 [Mycena rebaudengoi]|nr:hypothetical protein C8J57DRAFT_1256509 [Mycena rebaudengoi]KAJ7216853.1 hypothetical protein C8J57DRAFT_1255197 [Mycena rebaudengoi]